MIRAYAALLRDERRPLAFGFACAFLSSPGQTFFISLFIGAFARDLGLDATRLGALYMAATLGAAMLLPVTGSWIDRIDLRLFAFLAMGGLAVACGVVSLAVGPLSLLAGILLLRLGGQGLMSHIAITSTARHFHGNRGRALSLVSMGFPLAQGVLPALVVVMIAAFDWRMTYAICGAAVLVVAAPSLLWLVTAVPAFNRPTAGGLAGPRPGVLSGLRLVTSTRLFWLSLPLLLFLPFASTALTFHIQAIAIAKGWSIDLVALGFTGYAVSHVLTLVFVGGLIDRFGARAIYPMTNLPFVAGVAVLGLFGSPPALLVFLALSGVSSGLVQTTMAALWAEIFGAAQLGSIRSFVGMLTVGGTALGPVVVGVVLDRGFSVGAMCAGIVVAGLGAALLAAIGSRR